MSNRSGELIRHGISSESSARKILTSPTQMDMLSLGLHRHRPSPAVHRWIDGTSLALHRKLDTHWPYIDRQTFDLLYRVHTGKVQ